MFKWRNESELRLLPKGIAIFAPERTDLFCQPGGEPVTSASMYFREVSDDCVVSAKISMDPLTYWDGAGIFMMADDTHWIKGCLEVTNFGEVAVTSVATNGASDDANGPNVGSRPVWIQLVRKGGMFSVHYSLDNRRYDMVRICSIPMPEKIKAGLVVQAPAGPGSYRNFEEISVNGADFSYFTTETE